MSLILPSFELIPGKFNVGSLFAQIPMDGSGDLTVTRGTSATRFNASGVVQSVASGIPRLDYYTSGGVTGCPALLIEPAATNLAFHSENWGSNWALDGATRTTGSTSAFLSPDGTFTATALSPTSGNVSHYIYSNSPTKISFTSGTIYTQSVFFKQGTGVAGRYAQLTFVGGSFSQLGYANFDLQLGTVAVVSGTSADANRTARIENYGNGWYRCSLTATCTSSSSNEGVYCLLVNSSGNTRAQAFSGTVTDTLYGWGAQLETGSVATSYIPTTTGTVTRNADVISVSGAVSGSIGQTEGTIYMEVAVYSADKELFSISSGGVNGEAIRIQTNSDGKLGAVALVSNSQVITTSSINALNFGQFYKLAFAYKLNDYTLYLDGAAQTLTDITGGVPVNMNKLAFARPNDSFIQDQRVRAVALYNTRLTNAQLEFLTSPYTSYSQMATTLSYTIL